MSLPGAGLSMIQSITINAGRSHHGGTPTHTLTRHSDCRIGPSESSRVESPASFHRSPFSLSRHERRIQPVLAGCGKTRLMPEMPKGSSLRRRCTIASGCSKRPDFSPTQPRRLCHPTALSLPRQPLDPGTRRSAGKAAASEEARRYGPHFVGPFALIIGLGERKSPSSDSDSRRLSLSL